MKIKLLLFGEAVTIPSTKKGLGVTLVSVWVDGNGFQSASNDLGSLGYAFIETPTVDVGDVDPDTASLFTNLHGQVVSYDINSNTFVKSGGIVTVKMTVAVQNNGAVTEKSIQFQSSDCTGVCFITSTISFKCEMLQQENPALADADTSVFSDDDLVALQQSAPTDAVA